MVTLHSDLVCYLLSLPKMYWVREWQRNESNLMFNLLREWKKNVGLRKIGAKMTLPIAHVRKHSIKGDFSTQPIWLRETRSTWTMAIINIFVLKESLQNVASNWDWGCISDNTVHALKSSDHLHIIYRITVFWMSETPD